MLVEGLFPCKGGPGWTEPVGGRPFALGRLSPPYQEASSANFLFRDFEADG